MNQKRKSFLLTATFSELEANSRKLLARIQEAEDRSDDNASKYVFNFTL